MRVIRSVGLGLVFVLSAAFAGDLSPSKKWVSVSVDRDALALIDRFIPQNESSAKSAGEIAFVRVPEDKLPILSQLMHSQFGRCGGYMIEEDIAAAQTDWTSALRSVHDKSLVGSGLYTIEQENLVRELMAKADKENIRGTIQSLSAYRNRFYKSATGVASQQWVKKQWEGLAANNPNISVRLVQHASYPQPSVELTWQGKDLAEEVVVLGGHGDSIAGWHPGNEVHAPGADDNASGIGVITEVLRVLTSSHFVPERTLKFYAYAAEEVGLRGSHDIAAQHKRAGSKIQGVMQLDMTNFAGSSYDMVLISDYTNAAQNRYVGQLIEHYLPEIRWHEEACGYACSDHASWTRHSFPASFPFEAAMEEYNRKIHTDQDTLARSQQHAQHALPFARLALAYMVELSN